VKECSSSLPSLRRSILAGFVILSAAAVPLMGASFALAQSPTTTHPSSTAIRTPDFDESVRWYRDKLGFRLIADQNFVQGRTAVLERSGLLLELTEVDHVLPETNDPHSTGNVAATRAPVISLLVSDVDDEIERLRKTGVEVLQEPQDELDGRYRTAHIRDNGRHRIELREPINESGGFNPIGR
jgi:catechol 2,3-dioxygenase-like lactoylglutathione lyase family enzyme